MKLDAPIKFLQALNIDDEKTPHDGHESAGLTARSVPYRTVVNIGESVGLCVAYGRESFATLCKSLPNPNACRKNPHDTFRMSL